MNNENKKVLLKVEHLEQYFKLGKKTLKAVDDVNFEIYEGEVFGLVGESGCGKTTTGRSIIKLYDITGGSIYFDGSRIAAGINEYKEAIANAKNEYRKIAKDINQQLKTASEDEKVSLSNKLADAKSKCDDVVAKNVEEIKKAKYDHKNCDKEFAAHQVELVKEKYAPLLENLDSKSDEEKAEIMEKYNEEIRLAKKDRIMNKMQMIFQDPIASLDPRMTVHDIIAEGLVVRGIRDKKFIDKEVYRVLELVGLVPEHASRYPHEFSGGQRQRIGIARAIILNPQLIIADEPTTALDVTIQKQIMDLLDDIKKELRDKMGLTTLFIAHDLSVVKYFSDRIAVMYYGKIVEMASSDELFKNPLHPYTKSLLSAIPLPDPHYEKKRKRIIYNPLIDHDYSIDKPQMREIKPGHLIYCNETEFELYKKKLND